jgi:dynein light intermediate chain
MLLAPHSSLVRYDQPILVSSTKESKKGKKNADEKKPISPTVEILNSILPPREWTEDGQLWVQYVSSTPATKSDVVALQEHLDQKLQQRQARETGICPIREELYAQCFDELIRQITINCQERGLLLLRARDEIRMTIACYQTLYESSIAFGMRKALQSEQNKVEMQAKIKVLEGEKRELDKQVSEIKHRCELFERKDKERAADEAAKHKEEIEGLKKHNAVLRKELEQLLSVPTSSAFALAMPKET